MSNQNSSHIIAVGAGMTAPKKPEQAVSSLYLNYGLLGLVTNMHRRNIPVTMFQGNGDTPAQTFRAILTHIPDPEYPHIYMLSIPSFFSLDWALQFAALVKQSDANNKIIVGGRWVVDRNLEWIQNRFGSLADAYSLGCPDDCTEYFADASQWDKLQNKPVKYTHVFDHLEYPLLYGYQRFQPVIEVGRGCNRGCAFCMEGEFPPCRLEDPEKIVREAKYLEDLYHRSDLNIYFEAALFSPSKDWAQSFRNLYHDRNCHFRWRCNVRADTVNTSTFAVLADAGLKAVDVGLESASPTQLVRMNKTDHPDKYLRKAVRTINALSAHNVWCKLNILLYPGETKETFEETREWLLRHQNSIKGISANPLAVYLDGTKETLAWCQSIEQISGRKVDTQELLSIGMTYPDLSPEIDARSARILCRQLTYDVMTVDDYKDLKNMCYSQI